MVADIRAGRAPDRCRARPAALGAQHLLHAARAVRDDHQSLSDDVRQSLRLGGAAALMLAGVPIRQFFVLRHKGVFAVAATGGLAIIAAWRCDRAAQRGAGRGWSPLPNRRSRAPPPVWHSPSRKGSPSRQGHRLETPEQIAAQAAGGETVGNGYMPIGNLTQMTDGERTSSRRGSRRARDAMTAPVNGTGVAGDRVRCQGLSRPALHFVDDPAVAGRSALSRRRGARRPRRPR